MTPVLTIFQLPRAEPDRLYEDWFVQREAGTAVPLGNYGDSTERWRRLVERVDLSRFLLPMKLAVKSELNLGRELPVAHLRMRVIERDHESCQDLDFHKPLPPYDSVPDPLVWIHRLVMFCVEHELCECFMLSDDDPPVMLSKDPFIRLGNLRRPFDPHR